MVNRTTIWYNWSSLHKISIIVSLEVDGYPDSRATYKKIYGCGSRLLSEAVLFFNEFCFGAPQLAGAITTNSWVAPPKSYSS